jgi:hypothetical protein
MQLLLLLLHLEAALQGQAGRLQDLLLHLRHQQSLISPDSAELLPHSVPAAAALPAPPDGRLAPASKPLADALTSRRHCPTS